MRAYQFMPAPSSPRAQSPGKALSFALIAVTKRMLWKENGLVELKSYDSNILFLSIPIVSSLGNCLIMKKAECQNVYEVFSYNVVICCSL